MTKYGRAVLPFDWPRERLDRAPGSRRKPVDCVAGILLNDRKFLVEKRRDNDDADPGFIEIPGGHLEDGETLDGALWREMNEELGIEVEKARPIGSSLYTATNDEQGRIHYFHVEKWVGQILSTEAERVYWESDISNLSIIPDRKAVRKVLNI